MREAPTWSNDLLRPHSWEEKQKQMLPPQVEVDHPAKMTLVQRTGCARRAQDRNTCPGAGALPTHLHPSKLLGDPNREVQSVPRGERAAAPVAVERAPRRLSLARC